MPHLAARPRRTSPLTTALAALSLAGLLGACATGRASNFDAGMDKLQAGDEAGAKSLFEAALADPEDAGRAQAELDELALRRARDLLDQDRPAAVAIYRELLSRDADNHRARMGLGRALELDRQFDEAIRVLEENPGCGSCGTQVAEVYEQRGRQRMANADYAGANEDYQKALAVEPAPGVLIDISEMYTVGGHGSALAAAQALQQAGPLIAAPNTTMQELWFVERRDLALLAAAQHHFDAVELALSLPDPRVALDGPAREHAHLDLEMDVAAMYQEHEEYRRGLDLGIVALAEAEAGLDAKALAPFREELLALYSRHAHHLMSIGEARDAAILLTEALKIEPEHPLLRYQAVLAMSVVDHAIAEQMMENIPREREHWTRVHAIIRSSRAQRLLAEGDIEAAQVELFEAGKEYPDLLEVRLVRAEILAATPIDELNRGERRSLQKAGTIAYPQGTPTRVGEALAELAWCRARYQEEYAQLDPLRMPGFGARLATLEADLTAFYPYKVRRLPQREPRLRLHNYEGEAVSLAIEGPGIEQTVELAPGKSKTLVFEAPGVVTLVDEGAERDVAVVAEMRTLIDYPIGTPPSAENDAAVAEGDDEALAEAG